MHRMGARAGQLVMLRYTAQLVQVIGGVASILAWSA